LRTSQYVKICVLRWVTVNDDHAMAQAMTESGTETGFSTSTSAFQGQLIVAQWLRYRATNREVAGSIPDGVIGIFRWHNPSDHTMALGSTQPLTEMSTRSISWG
jgi:hypothetical protein